MSLFTQFLHFPVGEGSIPYTLSETTYKVGVRLREMKNSEAISEMGRSV